MVKKVTNALRTRFEKRFKKDKDRAYFIVFVLVLVALNIVISPISARLDFSAGKAYTLSESSKRIVKKIDTPVTIDVFMSSDLPAVLTPLKTDIIDLVNEYKRLKGGKIRVSVLDPKKSEDARKKAVSYQLPELQFSQVERDKYAVSESYFGIAVTSGDKTEIIPQATNLDSLEYDITSALYKISQKETIVIGLMGGVPVADPRQDPYYTLISALGRSFQVERVDRASPSGSFTLPSHIKTLLVFGDGNTYTDVEQKNIQTYLNMGGSAVFMLDGITVSPDLSSSDAQHNLFALLKDYGITLNKNLILSEAAEVANFSTGGMGFFTTYPYWIRTANFTPSQSVVNNVSAVTLPWASSIDVSKVPSIETTVLLRSEKNSWIAGKDASLMPNEVVQPDKSQYRELPLAVAARKKNGGAVTLISSSRVAQEQFLSEGRGNINFLINIVNEYASDGALSGIRARSVRIEPIQEVVQDKKDTVKYAVIFLLPVLFSMFGVYRLKKRL